MRIAGLDIGTTGCKLTVFDGSGRYLDSAYASYPSSRGSGGHEMDAEALMDGVFSVMEAAGRKYPDIGGIGVTSFGETFVLTDRAGVPLHRVMLDTDRRGAEECRRIEEQLGGREIAAVTGLRPHEMYSLPKMMWMKKYQPEIFQKASHLFLMEDFVVFGLTGKAQIDYSLASRTMAFDITAMEWSGRIFEAAGIDCSLMSEPVPPGTPAGNITKAVSRRTGLSPETVIVSVSHDQVAAAVGAGVFDPSQAVDGAGTVECMTVVYDSLPDAGVMYAGNYAVVPYVIPGTYLTYAFSYTGGALLQWCADTLAKKEKEEAVRDGISVNAYLEQEYQRLRGTEPSGLLVLPHFAGAATPYMDTGSKGAIVGLTVGSTVSDMYRGCMEGVVYEMRLNMEHLQKSGFAGRMLKATGGGARSPVWMQMKADILGLPVAALETADAGTVGSAMLTGISAGCFRDLEDAACHMVRQGTVYQPDRDRHDRYMKYYRQYRSLYQAVRPLVQ